MIHYNQLWKTMKKKGVSQYRLINHFNFSSGQLGRMKKNRNVSTHTINTLCRILECRVQDIMEYEEDPSDYDFRIPNLTQPDVRSGKGKAKNQFQQSGRL